MKRRGDGRVFQRPGSKNYWIQYSVRGRQYREPVGPNKAKARRKLKARLKEAQSENFVPPSAESVTVGALLDALLLHAQNVGLRSWAKLRSHAQAVRTFFGGWRAIDVSPEAMERFQHDRLAAGRKPATVNRECEALRCAFRLAAERKTFPRNSVPTVPTLPVENTRQGFFEQADIEALLAHVEDANLRDFIAWGFHTGMRKGEIAKLTWAMLDTSSEPWRLTIPGSITKNAQPRVLGLGGEARTIVARRIKARRLDCSLIFHRVSKGKPGQPVVAFDRAWRNALRAAGLPEGRLFHDLRRSAVRNLIRSGVDPSVAMKVSGHKTRSMLDRYNIIAATETAAALAQTAAWLNTQETKRNVEKGQFGDSRAKSGA